MEIVIEILPLIVAVGFLAVSMGCAFLLSLFLVRPPKLELVSWIGVLLFVLLPSYWFSDIFTPDGFFYFKIVGLLFYYCLGFGVAFYLQLSTLLCNKILHLLKYQNVSEFVKFSHIVVCDVILGVMHLGLYMDK